VLRGFLLGFESERGRNAICIPGYDRTIAHKSAIVSCLICSSVNTRGLSYSVFVFSVCFFIQIHKDTAVFLSGGGIVSTAIALSSDCLFSLVNIGVL
jgi:hypothetical protein